MFRRIAALVFALSIITGVTVLLGAPGPAAAQDAADFVVRLNRLEGQMRQLSGDVERLQFENRQLKDQLRKFQEDVEFRFQERSGGASRPAASTPAAPPSPATAPANPGPRQTQPQPNRRSDAFDPTAAPDAPGAPQVLGSTSPSAPLPLPGAALATPPGSIADLIEDDEDAPGTGPLDLSQAGRTPVAPRMAAPSPSTTATGNPRADYDTAYAYLLQRQFEQAEMGFRQFLQSHPRDRLVPDATFWLGETYLQRNRPREAAEQFLTVSTQHGSSPKAPDAMLKLGVALNALGAREQACATLAELERKFPQAAPNVRQGAERELRRARCV